MAFEEAFTVGSWRDRCCRPSLAYTLVVHHLVLLYVIALSWLLLLEYLLHVDLLLTRVQDELLLCRIGNVSTVRLLLWRCYLGRRATAGTLDRTSVR